MIHFGFFFFLNRIHFGLLFVECDYYCKNESVDPEKEDYVPIENNNLNNQNVDGENGNEVNLNDSLDNENAGKWCFIW
jgi:hypothetical protein